MELAMAAKVSHAGAGGVDPTHSLQQAVLHADIDRPLGNQVGLPLAEGTVWHQDGHCPI